MHRTSQDLYILGENLNQPKPEQNHHVVRNGRHDQGQFSAAEQKPLEAGHFQNLVYTLPKFRDTLSFCHFQN